MKNVCVLAICVLLFLFCVSSAVPALAQAASSAIIGLPVERNGVRFETWLASPKIVIPDKSVSYEKQKATVLFSVRVTNLTQSLLRINPYALSLKLVGPNGKELFANPLFIHGYVREPQESDYLLLQPAQSLILQMPSALYWQENHLCLSFPSRINGYSFVYEGLIVGTYQFSLHYAMPAATVPIRDDNTDKIVKTLNGFWTGDVTTLPQPFQLVTPL